MKRLQTATAFVFVLVLLAPATSAQDASWRPHAAFRQEMEELNRAGSLRNPLIFVHLSCADGAPEGNPPAGCAPLIRLLVRRAEPDRYRLPALPPNLIVAEARLRVDKRRLKEEKKDLTFFAQACERLPAPEICDEGWRLTKVWTVGELPADDLQMSLRTPLVKPGATIHGLGSETPEQTLLLEVPLDALAEGLLIPMWEQSGYLNVPATFSPRG